MERIVQLSFFNITFVAYGATPNAAWRAASVEASNSSSLSTSPVENGFPGEHSEVFGVLSGLNGLLVRCSIDFTLESALALADSTKGFSRLFSGCCGSDVAIVALRSLDLGPESDDGLSSVDLLCSPTDDPDRGRLRERKGFESSGAAAASADTPLPGLPECSDKKGFAALTSPLLDGGGDMTPARSSVRTNWPRVSILHWPKSKTVPDFRL